MNVDAMMTSLLLSAGQVLLLSIFFTPAPREKPLHAALLIAAGGLAVSFARCLETQDGLMRYISMAALYGLMVLLVRLWSGKTRRTRDIAQRVFCFLLLTECVTLVLSFVSQRLLGIDVFRESPLVVRAMAVAVLTGVHGALFALLLRLFPPEVCTDASTLRFCLLSALPYLFCCQITYWLPIDNAKVTPAVPLMTAASCLIALLLMATLEARLYAEREKRQALAQQHMLELRQQQYVQRRESMEAVRRTYHDMKNMLLYLEQAAAPGEEVKNRIQRIVREISGFETLLDTGNEAADILLSDKMAACQRENIACTVMVDGALLGFIRELDLVTILGNALDNAIEACRLLPPQRSRYVQVRTRKTPGFVLLHVINSCTGRARMEGNRFLTLKEDEENHGFGLSSIRRVAALYRGEMACRMDNGEFSLSLIFPREEQAEDSSAGCPQNCG